jgi:hypothetical protein
MRTVHAVYRYRNQRLFLYHFLLMNYEMLHQVLHNFLVDFVSKNVPGGSFTLFLHRDGRLFGVGHGCGFGMGWGF